MSAIPALRPPVIITDEPGIKYTNGMPLRCPHCSHVVGTAGGMTGKQVPGPIDHEECPKCEGSFTVQRVLENLVMVDAED